MPTYQHRQTGFSYPSLKQHKNKNKSRGCAESLQPGFGDMWKN